MNGANFGLYARQFVYKVLSEDPVITALGVTAVSEHPGPFDAVFPIITMSSDVPFLPRTNISENVLHAVGQLRIRVNSETRSHMELADISERMNDLLGGVNNYELPNGVLILTSRWQREHTWTEDRTVANNVISFRSLGAVFRIAVQVPPRPPVALPVP